MTTEERLGRVEYEMSLARSDRDEMKKDIKSILEFVNQTKGGRRALWGLLISAGAAGGLIGSIFRGIFSN